VSRRYRRDRPLLNAAAGLGLAAVIIHLAGHHGAAAPAGQVPAGVTAIHDHGPARGAAAKAVAFARAQLGKPYAWGAAGPDSYDCSGLTDMAWRAAGIDITRTSESQWAALRHVSRARLRPGDLVFYRGARWEQPPGHVALYLGHGTMIEAYAAGYPVRVADLRPGAWGYARPGGGA
jgi:cell wall-associated NlpC family hydrolase